MDTSEPRDTLTLLAQARAAGLTVFIDGGMLRVRGPKTAEALALAVLDHKPEVMALISAGDLEVQWRVAVLREHIPHRGPIWPVKVRNTSDTDTPGCCTLCGEPLDSDRAASPWRRCCWCVRALWLALNTTREDVTRPTTAA